MPRATKKAKAKAKGVKKAKVTKPKLKYAYKNDNYFMDMAELGDGDDGSVIEVYQLIGTKIVKASVELV